VGILEYTRVEVTGLNQINISYMSLAFQQISSSRFTVLNEEWDKQAFSTHVRNNKSNETLRRES
jgi:hypothetical protein